MATLISWTDDINSIQKPAEKMGEGLHMEANSIINNSENSDEDDLVNVNFMREWGFNLESVCKLAVQFIKEKEGKAIHLSYNDKLLLVAYMQQITHGPYDTKTSSPLGYLDVIGHDRRKAWSDLGDMNANDAMKNYVSLLDSVCSLFRTFVEAQKRDFEERQRKLKEEEERKRLEEEEEEERLRIEKEIEEIKNKELERQETQRRQIQEALNQQTYHQFKAYAEQQYPGNPEQQAVLVRQLQEQHYQQYMQQIYQQQLMGQDSNKNQRKKDPNDSSNIITNNNISSTMKNNINNDEANNPDDEYEGGSEDDESTTPEGPSVASASMWTRKDIKQFKDTIKKEGGEAILNIGHGETVTVRVPTHADGTCLFWEFATDSYDVGFGLYFEWTKSDSTEVSVHVCESEEEDDEDEYDEENGDIEQGASGRLAPANDDKPPVTVIIPIYRRDCQEEVYAGSHVYPGQGVYLLKFDNSYSLWRSKTLYYRVYYTR